MEDHTCFFISPMIKGLGKTKFFWKIILGLTDKVFPWQINWIGRELPTIVIPNSKGTCDLTITYVPGTDTPEVLFSSRVYLLIRMNGRDVWSILITTSGSISWTLTVSLILWYNVCLISNIRPGAMIGLAVVALCLTKSVHFVIDSHQVPYHWL